MGQELIREISSSFAGIEEIMGMAVPIVIFMIPIIAILTSHQRKMAELMHRNNPQPNQNPEINALRLEVYELKQLIQQQIIATDGLQKLSQTPPAPPREDLRERLDQV